jgi:hypothetical protein
MTSGDRSGHTSLITRTNTGIGRATAVALAWRGAGLFLACVLAGCSPTPIRIDDPDGSPAPWDAGVVVVPPGTCREATGIDLLIVIDNSRSMTEEQASLARQLPRFVGLLLEPPDADRDGEPDWLPIPDLHVGVVTTDMGSGGNPIPTCGDADFGDDGVLRTRGRADVPGCMATYPSFLTHVAGSRPPEALAFDVSCITRAGTGGCGFEHPLEATLKALSPAEPTAYTGPSYVPPRFFRDTLGHGLGANAGFVRDDTLLAVVIVTDEEDCSAADPDLFRADSPLYVGTDLNLRCFSFGAQALHPIRRYVDGLSALRAGRPDLLAFGLIVGVPVDLAVPNPTALDFERILADERMQERFDPDMPGRLTPSCDVTGRGLAFPPRRLVQVAQGLGPERASVQSICQEDFSEAARALARLFGRRACRSFG